MVVVMLVVMVMVMVMVVIKHNEISNNSLVKITATSNVSP